MHQELFGDANRTYIKLLRNASRKIWKHIFSSTIHGNNRGQTILLQVHRGTRSRYLRYTWQVSGLTITYRHSPLVYFQNVAKTSTSRRKIVNTFQDSGEAGISQHFLCKCIQLMTLRMRIFYKPLRRILTTVNSTISSNLWNSRQDWIGTSTTFLGNILGFFARNFHKSHTRNSTQAISARRNISQALTLLGSPLSTRQRITSEVGLL